MAEPETNNVVPLRADVELEQKEPKEQKSTRVAARWGTRLGKSFTPISRYFLHNAHRIKPAGMPNAKGLTPTESLVLIHLMDHKWDERDPYPALGTIAERMSLSRRQVRDTMKRLEDLGLISRVPSVRGGTNRIDMGKLLVQLEALMDEDVAATDAQELNAGAVQ